MRYSYEEGFDYQIFRVAEKMRCHPPKFPKSLKMVLVLVRSERCMPTGKRSRLHETEFFDSPVAPLCSL